MTGNRLDIRSLEKMVVAAGHFPEAVRSCARHVDEVRLRPHTAAGSPLDRAMVDQVSAIPTAIHGFGQACVRRAEDTHEGVVAAAAIYRAADTEGAAAVRGSMES
ncbi:hypothetical protein [Nocardia panacis]|nr:hypothetical protein [Nocardia panacis]